MALLEDLAPYFADFGDAATLDGVAVRGIFERPYAEQFGMASAEPTFLVPAAAVAHQGSVLVIQEGPGAGTWRVRVPQPDGTGLLLLPLERA